MAGSNGAGTAIPAAYPPPVDSPEEFIKRELDPEDEIIEVGVAIVGGGTAGLACANRLLQLLAEDEALLERLGEVPVAVEARGEVVAVDPGARGYSPLGNSDGPAVLDYRPARRDVGQGELEAGRHRLRGLAAV